MVNKILIIFTRGANPEYIKNSVIIAIVANANPAAAAAAVPA